MAADPKHRVQPDSVEPGRIALVCPCGKTVSVQAELAGKKVRCRECERVLVVDAYTTSAPAPQAESIAMETESATVDEIDKTDDSLEELPSMLAPPQAADEIGRLGPYRVLQVLGMGGMGVVFKAEDPGLDRIVALKAMLPQAAQKKSAKERFLREARAAAALKHDHVVSIFQVGEDRGIPFFAMEFLEGESLEDRLKRDPLSIDEVLRIGREIADGLGAAHERDLIHRDIKPANIWLEKRSVRRKDGKSDASTKSAARVKILDFGLARGLADPTITQSGAIMGTPHYMAPEQANGERVDSRCDLYSLGVILYRMVTGDMPFEGNSLMVLAAKISQTPAQPCSRNPNIPARLNDLIMRLLGRNADDRPATASDVYAALCDIEETPGMTPTMAPAAAGTGGLMFMPRSSPPRSGETIATNPSTVIVETTRSPLLAQAGPSRAGMRLALGLLGVVIAYAAPPILLQHAPRVEALAWFGFDPTLEEPDEAKPDASVEAKREVEQQPTQQAKPDLAVAKVEPKPTPDPKPPVLSVPLAPVRPVMKAGDEITNSLGMRMVYIAPGKFLMGSPKSESDQVRKALGDWAGDMAAQAVQHEVEIANGFWLCRYAVTQEEYGKVMGLGVSPSRLPVVNVSWEDAKNFCRKLSAKEQKEYRLPTEAEWEYACRAGTKTAYNVGETLTELDANFDDKKRRPTPVGSYPANAWGLYDMHGNVGQWCEDRYEDKNSKNSPTRDPQDPSVRVIRGGNWHEVAWNCRSAYRDWYQSTNKHFTLGFRVVLQAAK
jgi:eukaryotic-like serine/threonine-protein kinase